MRIATTGAELGRGYGSGGYSLLTRVKRTIWIAVSLIAGSGLLLYILAAVLMPKAESEQKDLQEVMQPENSGVNVQIPTVYFHCVERLIIVIFRFQIMIVITSLWSFTCKTKSTVTTLFSIRNCISKESRAGREASARSHV